MIFLKQYALGTAMMLLLSGCEIPVMIAAEQNDAEMTGMFEITFPAVLLVQTSDGGEEFLTGELRGYANGNSNFTLVGPTYGTCQGSSTSAGDMLMVCENGFQMDRNVGRQRARMTGTFALEGTWEGTDYIGVMGWGRDASEDAVRSALSEARRT